MLAMPPPIPDPYTPLDGNFYAPGTNPGGLLWVQYIASKLCLPLSPSKNGGSDYALSLQDSTNMLATVQNYVTNLGPCSNISNNLFSIYSGTSDLSELQGGNMPHLLPLSDVPPAVATMVSNISQAFDTLHAAGGQYFMVLNIPMIAVIPGLEFLKLLGVDNVAAFTYAQFSFDGALRTTLNAKCYDVLQLDFDGLTTQVFANPNAYGFTNISAACACPDPLGGCPPVSSPACPGYYWWDFSYMTGAANELLGDYVNSIFDGINCFAGLSEVPLGAIFAQNVTIRQQLPPIRKEQDLCAPYVFVGANYSPLLERPKSTCCYQSNQKARSFSVVIGSVLPMTDCWALGASYGFTRPQSAKSNCCSFLNNMHTASAFMSYHQDSYYINTILNGSYTNFDVTRSFYLLEKRTTACGNTHGNQLGVIAEGCYYLMDESCLKGGILADVEYNRIRTYGYTESGAGAANLAYNDRLRHSIITGVGLQATYQDEYKHGNLLVNFFALVNKDWKTGKKNVEFHVASIRGSHARLPVCRPHQVFATLGLDASLTRESGLVLTGGYHTRLGNNHLQDQVISFGAALSF